jgi:hypothetical protein
MPAERRGKPVSMRPIARSVETSARGGRGAARDVETDAQLAEAIDLTNVAFGAAGVEQAPRRFSITPANALSR